MPEIRRTNFRQIRRSEQQPRNPLPPDTILSPTIEPVPIACHFDPLGLMLIVVRGGMGADDNTLQVGNAPPVPIAIGSNLMSASYQGQEFSISLRMPANVTDTGPGNSEPRTFDGQCISSPPS
jgi:hypothetical protein